MINMFNKKNYFNANLRPVDLNKHIAEVKEIFVKDGYKGLADKNIRLYGVIVMPGDVCKGYYFIRGLTEYGFNKEIYCPGLTILADKTNVSFIIRYFRDIYADCVHIVIPRGNNQ